MKYNSIYLFLFIALLLSGCRTYDDYLYEVVDMKAENADNSGKLTESTTVDSIAKIAYAIHLEYTMEFKGEAGDDADLYESNFRNEFDLTSFKISTTSSFDNTHPAGSSLNEYFLYSSGGSYNSKSTIESLVTGNKIGRGERNSEVIPDSWTSDQYLILMVPPPSNGSYTFIIEIEQSNNTVLSDSTSIIFY